MLKQISHAPLSDGNVDALFSIKEVLIPTEICPSSGFFNAGHTAGSLPTAGSPEDAEDSAAMMKLHIEGERAPIFIGRNVNHAGRLLHGSAFQRG